MVDEHSLARRSPLGLEQKLRGSDVAAAPSGTEETSFVQAVAAIGPHLAGLAQYLEDKCQREVDDREKQVRPAYHKNVEITYQTADAIVQFLNDFVSTTAAMGGDMFADYSGDPQEIHRMLENSRKNSLQTPHLVVDVRSGVDMGEQGGRGYARKAGDPPLTYTDVKIKVQAYSSMNPVPVFAAHWRLYVPAGHGHAFYGSGRGIGHEFGEQAIRKIIEFDEQYPVMQHGEEAVGAATLAMRMLGEYCQKMIERPKGGGFLLR